ncbi:MAG TPA: hypothetical protein PLS76_02580 [Acinetobacter sp.]|nr:hypothetical protein [Acinetobacter sp.]HQW52402.1 hypothetical protein [Acinetobacter sp.]
MANRVFELKPSRVEKGFQSIMLLLILSLLYPLLSVWMWLLSALLILTAWFFFLKRAQLRRFEYLDDGQWSFSFDDHSASIQRRKITRIIDHNAYIVLYFSESSQSPCVIWWDQLPELQWKNLKMLVKLL